MMGVGKSTIGKILSKKLRLQFIDIDKIIEKNQKKTINEIFQTKGEVFFRNLEEKTTLKYIKKNNLIIDLGGGAFMSLKIRDIILKNNRSFWLDTSLNSLKFRVKRKKTRPLLSDNINFNLKKIYGERKKIYRLANFKINCDKLGKNEIANRIVKLYEKD